MRSIWTVLFILKVSFGAVCLMAWPFADTSKYESVFSYGNPFRCGMDNLFVAYLIYFAFVQERGPLSRMTKERL